MELDRKVVAIILNWNGWDDTFVCLSSIRQLSEFNHVWLVDNGSDQDRSGEAIAIYPGITIIKLDENFGWAGGYNRALRMAASKQFTYAYLLNNDCEVSRNFLSTLVDAADQDEYIAAVGSQIIYADPAGYVKFDGCYHSPCTKPFVLGTQHRSVPAVNGAGMLVRLQAMEESGYFDERFFCYGEEEEWCLRMGKHGWKIIVCEDSVIIHRGEGSNINHNAIYYRVRNRYLMLEGEPVGDRLRGISTQIYSDIRWANELRRLNRQTEWYAVMTGLEDGMRKKFGKRSRHKPSAAFRLLAHIWRLPSGFFRRLLTKT